MWVLFLNSGPYQRDAFPSVRWLNPDHRGQACKVLSEYYVLILIGWQEAIRKLLKDGQTLMHLNQQLKHIMLNNTHIKVDQLVILNSLLIFIR